MRADSVGGALLEAASHDSAGVSFWTDPGESTFYSYSTLAQNARAVAASLQKHGVKRGESVAIILPTGPEFYAAFFGASLAGAVPTALYPPTRLGRVNEWKVRTATMLCAAESVVVLTERRLAALLGEPVRTARPRLGCRLVQTLQEESRGLGPKPVDTSALATIQFSSGSTGDPKPVALSHENMLSNAHAILDALPVPAEERSGVSWLPLYHDMGLIGCLLSSVISQAPMTLMGPERFVAKPIRWLQALSETRATISVAPNFAFGLTVNKADQSDIEDLDLSNWKVALCGAEPVHPRTLDDFATRFSVAGFSRRALTPVYGLAEATLAVTFSNPEEAPRWERFDTDLLENQGLAKPSTNGRLISSLGRPLTGCRLRPPAALLCKATKAVVLVELG